MKKMYSNLKNKVTKAKFCLAEKLMEKKTKSGAINMVEIIIIIVVVVGLAAIFSGVLDGILSDIGDSVTNAVKGMI